MDMRDKYFDNWIQDTLDAEITVGKQKKLAAWEQIRIKAALSTKPFSPLPDYCEITDVQLNTDSFLNSMWKLFVRFIIHENTYHKAHTLSANQYKTGPNYTGGLSLHSIEFMRYRWACSG